ncbi:nitroreductase family deazaflavin-dependent oxidoreductase [Mycolicibacterium sp. XJ1819]
MRAKDHPNNAPGIPMIFPPWIENLQVKYFNRMVKPFAPYLPGVATIHHLGRKSSKPYETIVTAYRKGNTVAVALGHGKTDWVKNVLAAGEAELQYRRRSVHLTNPRIVPAGTGGEDLPAMARAQAKKVAIFLADVS